MMHTWFECKIRYEKVMENGMNKKVTEPYLVDALSFTEAEARIIEEITPFISGEFTVSDIKRANYSELFFCEEDAADRWFKCKLFFITLDEKSGAEKKTSTQVLVQAADLRDAVKKLDGLRLLVSIVPALVMLLTAVHLLRASGAVDLLTRWLTPAARVLGLPPQVLPLVLLRPVSGSAALAVGADLMAQYGADSLIGRTAAVVLGSTETTFYTISVYFGAAGIRRTRYAVPAALIADLTGFLVAALTARFL